MNILSDIYYRVCSDTQNHINSVTGKDCNIGVLAETIKSVSGYEVDIVYDKTKLDGTPRKLLGVSLLSSLGWQSSIDIDNGLADTWAWFLKILQQPDRCNQHMMIKRLVIL